MAKPRGGRIELYRNAGVGEWRWIRRRKSTGVIIQASRSGFETEQDARDDIAREAPGCPIEVRQAVEVGT